MSMARLVVTAVLVEGRTKSEVARDYGVSRRWVVTLVQRFLAEGEAGLEPRSRRPKRSPVRRRWSWRRRSWCCASTLTRSATTTARRRSPST